MALCKDRLAPGRPVHTGRKVFGPTWGIQTAGRMLGPLEGRCNRTAGPANADQMRTSTADGRGDFRVPASSAELHMPIAIIGWDRMRLLTTRKTPLTGDVKTVAALNVMQIAPFQIMDRWCSNMLDPGFQAVATMR